MRVLLFDRAEGELSIDFIEKKKEFMKAGSIDSFPKQRHQIQDIAIVETQKRAYLILRNFDFDTYSLSKSISE